MEILQHLPLHTNVNSYLHLLPSWELSTIRDEKDKTDIDCHLSPLCDFLSSKMGLDPFLDEGDKYLVLNADSSCDDSLSYHRYHILR